MADYEYRTLDLRRGASVGHTREVLGIHAEFGGWELLQHAVWPDGRRKVTVRRKLQPDAQPPLPT